MPDFSAIQNNPMFDQLRQRIIQDPQFFQQFMFPLQKENDFIYDLLILFHCYVSLAGSQTAIDMEVHAGTAGTAEGQLLAHLANGKGLMD